jgi:hypothetical protein
MINGDKGVAQFNTGCVLILCKRGKERRETLVRKALSGPRFESGV